MIATTLVTQLTNHYSPAINGQIIHFARKYYYYYYYYYIIITFFSVDFHITITI